MHRRWLYQTGSLALLNAGWRHRGSLVRGLDWAKRLPGRMRDGRTAELVTEARAIMALDRELRTDTSIRITGVNNGTVSLRGQPAGSSLDTARSVLLPVADIVDIRTDDLGQPTLDNLVAGSRL